ncbi:MULTISPECIES: ABC transporter substrate-binding protein [unclassified Aeromicrobium]|uniref:ABC transporter substrate-binding protein n=1 Tax=unclassified Aeromicrobium TaxID=2633570 RepID=UPI00396B21A4
MTPHPTLRGCRRPLTALAALGLGASLLGACGSSDQDSTAAGTGAITVENCGEEMTVDQPVETMYAYDGGIISIALAAGARDQIVAVTGMDYETPLLKLAYPDDRVDELKEVGDDFPTLENVLAVNPELMFAGYGYGFSESRNLMPEMLHQRDIATYLLSETCQQEDGARGTMDPWTALETDLANIGELTGHRETADAVVADIKERRAALESAPGAKEKPTAFLVDSTGDAIFTSGKFGGPQAIFDTAGLRNAAEDVEDTWTEVAWERLAASDPDVIFFVEYPGQSYEQKVKELQANPASRNLTAVKEKRFVNLPYSMWVSSPLNIDAAEWIRQAAEHWDLLPDTDIASDLDITSLTETLPGNEWAR